MAFSFFLFSLFYCVLLFECGREKFVGNSWENNDSAVYDIMLFVILRFAEIEQKQKCCVWEAWCWWCFVHILMWGLSMEIPKIVEVFPQFLEFIVDINNSRNFPLVLHHCLLHTAHLNWCPDIARSKKHCLFPPGFYFFSSGLPKMAKDFTKP